MADILNLISTSSQNSEERYKFIQDLIVNKSDVPFDNEEVNQIQNTLLLLINNQLNHAFTRHDGLKLLLKTLPRCSKETLIKHGTLWMTKALQILDSAQNDAVQVTTACQVIASLAVASKDIPELQKQVSVQNVKQIVAHVNGLPEEKRFGAVFYLLAVLLYHYPEPCERLNVTIRKLILPLVDSEQESLVRAGAKCFALLTFATERSFQPPANRQNLTAWTYSQILICNSIHETMDALFSGVTEIETVDAWDKLALPDIPQTDVMVYYLGLERRFNNLCVYLGTTLRGCGPKNSISPGNIFKVLSRGLFVTPAGLGNENAFRKQILHLILPNLHTSLLHVFDAVVTGFGKELVPYAQTILQLLQQILTWTEVVTDNSSTLDGTRPFKRTRIQAYKSLSTWLTRAGVLSGLENVCDEFLAHILRDVVPEKDRVVLSVQKTHNMSKRALKRHREKQYDNNLTQSSIANVQNPLANADIAEEALISLQNIFLNTGCRLKVSFHETSQRILVSLLYDCYLETHKQTFYKRLSACRLELLRTLKMLQLNPHPSIPSPTQYSLEIFQMAQNDSDPKVAREAKIGIAEIEKTVHPGAPTLRLPITVGAESPEDEETEAEFAMETTIVEKDVVNDVLVPAESQSQSATEEVVENSVEESREVSDCQAEPEVEMNSRSQEAENSEENRISDSSPIEEINLDSEVDEPDEDVVEMTVQVREDPKIAIRDEASVVEVDEPLAKRQHIESKEIIVVESSKELEGDGGSDDDATMLDLFCDTVQEDHQ